MQGLTKVVSRSPGLVDFPVGQADFIDQLSVGQAWLKFVMACPTNNGLVQNSYRHVKLKSRLPKGRAWILIFVVPWLWRYDKHMVSRKITKPLNSDMFIMLCVFMLISCFPEIIGGRIPQGSAGNVHRGANALCARVFPESHGTELPKEEDGPVHTQ